RGGTVLPSNVVQVRPNKQVPGYVAAQVDDASVIQAAGSGTGSESVRVVNPALVPDGHHFRIEFDGPAVTIRATTYSLWNETTGALVFDTGRDLEGEGSGPVGFGVQPVIRTPLTVEVDTLQSGFQEGSPTNAVLEAHYATALPINLRRPGYPE